MKKNILLLSLTIFVFCAAFANAETVVKDVYITSGSSFEVSHGEDKGTIYPGEEAIYKLALTNNLNTADTYRLSTKSMDWSILTDPLSDYFSGIRIESKSTYTTIVKFMPAKNIRLGPHIVEVQIKSGNTDQSVSDYYSIEVLPPYGSGGYPAIESKIEFFQKGQTNKKGKFIEIDPREEFVVRLTIDNKNTMNMSDLKVTIAGKTAKKEQTITMAPLEKGKIADVVVNFDPMTAPQEDELKISFSKEGYTIITYTQPIEIIDYTGEFEGSIVSQGWFLNSARDVTFTNNGNAKRAQTGVVKTNIIESLFSSTAPKSKIIKDENGRYFAWDMTLAPGEKYNVQIKTNYIPLFIILLIAAIIGAVSWILKSPILIKKTAPVIEVREGGISEIKIVLHVKNSGKKSLRDVEILDKIPNIADYIKESEMGTIHPIKVLKHESKGTLVKWFIDELDSHEERVITYRMKSRLNILGAFTLPSAMARYKDEKGNKIVVHSNKASVSS